MRAGSTCSPDDLMIGRHGDGGGKREEVMSHLEGLEAEIMTSILDIDDSDDWSHDQTTGSHDSITQPTTATSAGSCDHTTTTTTTTERSHDQAVPPPPATAGSPNASPTASKATQFPSSTDVQRDPVARQPRCPGNGKKEEEEGEEKEVEETE